MATAPENAENGTRLQPSIAVGGMSVMKVSTKGRYALRMMIFLARWDKSTWASLKEVSWAEGISIKYLEQIANSLAKDGLVESRRGAHGGYRLARAPEEYTVGEILRSIEGNLAPVSCLDHEVNPCSFQNSCTTLGFWEGLRDTVNEYVDGSTLADLSNKPLTS